MFSQFPCESKIKEKVYEHNENLLGCAEIKYYFRWNQEYEIKYEFVLHNSEHICSASKILSFQPWLNVMHFSFISIIPIRSGFHKISFIFNLLTWPMTMAKGSLLCGSLQLWMLYFWVLLEEPVYEQWMNAIIFQNIYRVDT